MMTGGSASVLLSDDLDWIPVATRGGLNLSGR
jgi:hypothetical protein